MLPRTYEISGRGGESPMARITAKGKVSALLTFELG
jgi:hypothetical protein